MAKDEVAPSLKRSVARARKAKQDVQQARQELREGIRIAREDGMTLDAIAAMVGVSRQRILQLLSD